VKSRVQPTQLEKLMREEDFIVSKTDLKGHITYGNRTFIEFCGYPEEVLLNAPHNIIRHPDMPRGIFKFAWNEIERGREVFAYVKNLSADGSFYWVFATMTPSFNKAGQLVGYYSVRRAPKRESVKIIGELYRRMLNEENRVERPMQADASLRLLHQFLAEKGQSYADFILSI
jgi:PAS domain S-box-containing protein